MLICALGGGWRVEGAGPFAALTRCTGGGIAVLRLTEPAARAQADEWDREHCPVYGCSPAHRHEVVLVDHRNARAEVGAKEQGEQQWVSTIA